MRGVINLQQSKELIGILQSISIIAKRLAERLIKIEAQINEYEIKKY